MPSPTELYPLVLLWLQALGVAPHATARPALAHLLAALLATQSLRASALMRALPSPEAVPARQRYRRVARSRGRARLSPAALTPALVRAALALAGPDPAGSPTAGLTHLALDGVRLGRWELLVLGVCWHGRVLPVGWAALPYPWPKGRFTPTACALVRSVAAAWPAGRPAHLLADRGFPSRPLFLTLRGVGWGWTVRLRARSWVTVDGEPRWVRGLLQAAGPAGLAGWAAYPGAAYGGGPRALPGTVVVGRGLAVLPAHQRGPGGLRARAALAARRRRHVASKHPGRADASAETDAWVALFTSHRDGPAAAASYARRWAIEGSFRDAQGGWDGRHGWDLERAAARLRAAAEVEALAGLWALGTLLQSWLGHRAGLAAAPAAVRAARRGWCTTARLSVWARGKLALADPATRPWAARALRDGARRVAPTPPPSAPVPLPAAAGRRKEAA